MKFSFLAFVSALILAHGVNAHAKSPFVRALNEERVQPTTKDTQNTQDIASLYEGQELGSEVETVSYCESTCGASECCDSGCDSWFSNDMCPGTGAFGGDSRFSGFIGFNQDTFFGNYTTASAGYAINSKVDATFYSILWHTDFFSQNGLNGPSRLQGTGLWTEFGGGLNFKSMDGALNINPQFGILNGALLSSGGGTVQPQVFDGFVPNLTANYGGDLIQSQLYMGYYFGAQGVDQNDYLHWWYNSGISPWSDHNSFLSTISTGVHYEMLRQTAPAEDNLYQWIGPYFQVALPNGFSMRYSAGTNVDDGANLGSDFYKVNLGYSF